MQNIDFYSNAHLFVAAIRISEHQNNTPPSVEKICQALSFSLERGNHICRKLHEMGVIKVVEGTFGTRLFIQDHLLLEEIPQDTQESRIEKDLKKFKNAKKDYDQEIESIRATLTEKKKNLFADIEDKLRKGLDKK